MVKARKTQRDQKSKNGITEKFEEEVLKASTEKDQLGPFKSANDAIAALHKKSK